MCAWAFVFMHVCICMYHIVLFLFSASVLSTVGDLGKSYVVWEEIFDNGLKVQALHGCVV